MTTTTRPTKEDRPRSIGQMPTEDSDPKTLPAAPLDAVEPESRAGGMARAWLIAIICFYSAFCLAYNFFTPIGEGPDEIKHVKYVEYLVKFHMFPPIDANAYPDKAERPYMLEAKQPPTYYFIDATLMLAMGRSGKQLIPKMEQDPSFGASLLRYIHPPLPLDLAPWIHIMRVVGMLFGIGTILLAFATARELFPGRDSMPLAVGAAAIVGLLPGFAFISSIVNNDHLAIFVGSAVSYWMVLMLRRGVTARNGAFLGALLGAALLTKANLLIYVGLGLFVMLLPGLPNLPMSRAASAWREWSVKALRFLRSRLPFIVATGLICVAVGGWWMLRNQFVYGDLLADDAVNQMVRDIRPSAGVVSDISDIGSHLRQVVYTIDTHFGWFGFELIKAPRPFYIVYYVLIFLSAVGAVYELIKRKLHAWQSASLLLGILILELSYISLIYHTAWRGRLIYPALVFTSLLLVRGTYSWMRLLAKNRPPRFAMNAAAGLWIAFFGLSSVYCLLAVVVPSFYGKT